MINFRSPLRLVYVVIENIREKREVRRLEAAQKLLKKYGLSSVKLEHIAGTDYIVNPDGTRYRIGREK